MKEQEGILYLFALLHLSVNLSSDTVQTLPTYVYNISINLRLLEKRHKYDKPELSWYFKWGFGHNHFWVSDLNGVRLIFVEF